MATDRFGNPVPDVPVFFAAPSGGPGGTFADGRSYETDKTDANGNAIASPFTADSTAGHYYVVVEVEPFASFQPVLQFGVTNSPTPPPRYWLAAVNGAIENFGATSSYGSAAGVRLHKPVVGMAAVPDGDGYWLVASDGGVFSFGPGAHYYGSTGGIALNKSVVGMAAAPDRDGYWLVASDGGIFNFGAGAPFLGAGTRIDSSIMDITER